MFDNRWDNWSGDFAESFGATQLHPAIRNHISDVLKAFGDVAKRIDPGFPDDVRPGTYASVVGETLPRLSLPAAAKPHAAEVVAKFLEYLQETGRVAEGNQIADEIREVAKLPAGRHKPAADPKGVPIKRPAGVSPIGRNDPCPCGSGKKYKKCCLGEV